MILFEVNEEGRRVVLDLGGVNVDIHIAAARFSIRTEVGMPLPFDKALQVPHNPGLDVSEPYTLGSTISNTAIANLQQPIRAASRRNLHQEEHFGLVGRSQNSDDVCNNQVLAL